MIPPPPYTVRPPGRGIAQRVGETDRIGREELVIVESVDHIHTVRLLVAVDIRLLYRSPRRGIVTRHGKTHGRAVVERYLILHQPLAEGAATYDKAAVVVLQRSGQNLARRCAPLVHQHGQIDVRRTAEPVAELLVAMPPPIFGVDYKTPLGQKFVGYHYRLIQKAARITPQVEYQTLHALAAQTCQRPKQLDMRRARELRQTHVTDMTLAVEHKRRIDAVQLYGIAHDLYLDLVADALTAYRQTHVRTARSAQTLYDILLRYVAPCHERVVDTHDTVAGTHSRAVARPLGNDVHDNDRIGGRIEHYAYAVELAVERFVDLIELLGRNIYRVGGRAGTAAPV